MVTNANPATQASVDSLAERVARMEKLQEEHAAKLRVAVVALGAGIVVTAVGVRAANRRNSGSHVQIPAGYSLTALPPSTAYNR